MYELLNNMEILAPCEAFDKGFAGDYCICEYPYIRNHSQKIKISNATWQEIFDSEFY